MTGARRAHAGPGRGRAARYVQNFRAGAAAACEQNFSARQTDLPSSIEQN